MLKIEVLKFEAQDIITSSIPVQCICDGWCGGPLDGHSFWSEKEDDYVYCPASEHPNCPIKD